MIRRIYFLVIAAGGAAFLMAAIKRIPRAAGRKQNSG